MKNNIIKTAVVLPAFLLCFAFSQAQTFKKPGLLVLSHGSSNASVNSQVEAMVQKMRVENESKKVFHAIENAFLEVGAPRADIGVQRLEAAGCDGIIVVPFFTSQDGHTQNDIPVVLGLSNDAEVLAELKEEGIPLAHPTVPVKITGTLNETDLLSQFLKEETAKLSTDPKKEALVVIALEENDYKKIVFPTIKKATKYAAQSNGIKHFKDVYSWQDETFWANAAPAIKSLSKKNDRVIIISVYTTRSAKSLFDNALKAGADKKINTKDGFGSGKLVLSDDAFINFNQTPKAVLELGAKSL